MKAKNRRYVPKHAVGGWLNGEEDESRELSHQHRDEQPVEGWPPTWNTSTAVLRTLHGEMRDRGWDHGMEPEIPSYQGEVEQLPERPLDLGAGWWR